MELPSPPTSVERKGKEKKGKREERKEKRKGLKIFGLSDDSIDLKRAAVVTPFLCRIGQREAELP